MNSSHKDQWRGVLIFNLLLNKRLSKPSRRHWFETPSRLLLRHCNDWLVYKRNQLVGYGYHTVQDKNDLLFQSRCMIFIQTATLLPLLFPRHSNWSEMIPLIDRHQEMTAEVIIDWLAMSCGNTFWLVPCTKTLPKIAAYRHISEAITRIYIYIYIYIYILAIYLCVLFGWMQVLYT